MAQLIATLAIFGLAMSAKPAKAGYYNFSATNISGQQSVTYGSGSPSTSSTTADYFSASVDSGGSTYALPYRTSAVGYSRTIEYSYTWVPDNLNDPAPTSDVEVEIESTATINPTSVDIYDAGYVEGSATVTCTGDSETGEVWTSAWYDSTNWLTWDGDEEWTGEIPLFYRTTISGSSGTFQVSYGASASMDASSTISAGLSVSYLIGTPLVLITRPPSGSPYNVPTVFSWASPPFSASNYDNTKRTFSNPAMVTVRYSALIIGTGYSGRIYSTARHGTTVYEYDYIPFSSTTTTTPSTVTSERMLDGQGVWVMRASLKLSPPGAYPLQFVQSLNPIRLYAKN